MSAYFKTCPHCKTVWETLNGFLSDSAIDFAGYQVNFEDLKGGLFYFTHLTQECGTTLAIPVGEFIGLSNRPMLASHGKQPDGCPGLCVRKRSRDLCPVQCECFWVREIIQTIHEWKKQTDQPTGIPSIAASSPVS